MGTKICMQLRGIPRVCCAPERPVPPTPTNAFGKPVWCLAPFYIFWPQSPNSPDFLRPENFHSLIMLWKNVRRQLDWWEYSLLISEVFCRNIIFVLFSWPLLAASKSRRGSLRERCERRSLEPASRSACCFWRPPPGPMLGNQWPGTDREAGSWNARAEWLLSLEHSP